MRLLPLILLLATVAAAFLARPARTEPQRTDSGLTFEVWMPPGFAQHRERVPLIVFSHGFGGCAQQSKFLTEALAADGYLVVAPNHADARCNRAGGRTAFRPEEPFRDDAAWSDATYRVRHDDIEALIAFVLAHEPYASRIDVTRMGVMGHSLGGYTALGMAGAWPSWKDARVKAVLALSPYAKPFIDRDTLHAMSVPVMYQGGTLDLGITPFVARAGGAYDRSNAPKYFVEFRRAGHLAWTDLNPMFHQEINAYALAFFDKYLKREGAVVLSDNLGRRVADFRAEAR